MKTIHFFGDSWTKGDGCQFVPGSGIIDSKIKYGPDYSVEYNTFSFPSQMKQYLPFDANISNNGSSGSSNFQIYKKILDELYNNKFKSGDIVVVSWTSIVREPLPFLFSREHTNSEWDTHGINYSVKGHIQPQDHFVPSWISMMRESKSKKISKKIYEDFIVDRINLNLLHEICMNYVCNLQILFKEIGIDYLFINTFENIISKEVFFYDKIKKDKWLLFDYTLSDYLCDIEDKMEFSSGYSLWEDDFIKPGRNFDGPHPNRIGYNHIAKLISETIISKKII
jgi:hypothetical protein